MRNGYGILGGESEDERSLGRFGSKIKNRMKIDHKETGCEVVGWIQLAYYWVQ
jgi:hypothetical protein